jgi:hypothetical protein
MAITLCAYRQIAQLGLDFYPLRGLEQQLAQLFAADLRLP